MSAKIEEKLPELKVKYSLSEDLFISLNTVVVEYDTFQFFSPGFVLRRVAERSERVFQGGPF